MGLVTQGCSAATASVTRFRVYALAKGIGNYLVFSRHSFRHPFPEASGDASKFG